MTFTSAHLSMSLDGFVAGPDQSLEDPLGRGGMQVHRWHLETDNDVDARWSAEILRPGAAYVMGRNMFGPVRGPWSSYGEAWRGWWGEEPPYRAPVFVLTHHPHESIEMAGGTTFHFVTDGFESAFARASEAGNGDVNVAGGASTVRQALRLGVLDELTLDVASVLLGSGERLFDADVRATLEQVEAEHSPWVTHVRYRIVR